MTITLTYNGTTAALSDRLHWSDEFDWSPVEQSKAYSTTGKLLVDVALKDAGQPITLQGNETAAWISRNLCVTLHAWAKLPGIQLTLTLRGQAHLVMFDHPSGFQAQPIWKLLDGEITGELFYIPTFRFFKV